MLDVFSKKDQIKKSIFNFFKKKGFQKGVKIELIESEIKNYKILCYNFTVNTNKDDDLRFLIDFKMFIEDLLKINREEATIFNNGTDVKLFYNKKTENYASFFDRTVDLGNGKYKKVINICFNKENSKINDINMWVLRNGGTFSV